MGHFLAQMLYPRVRLVHDNALHCHPTFNNIPETPLERRSMRIDRTKDQKSCHVTNFFTVTFLLPCLQPVTALPKVWSCHLEPRASAHTLNAEATAVHLTCACSNMKLRSYCNRLYVSMCQNRNLYQLMIS